MGITVGLTVMILALAIVTGFKNEIRDKVIGFGSHIQIRNYDNNDSFEASPMSRQQDFLKVLNENPEIRHVQVFATKAGIIKTHEELQGVVVKGIGSDFDWDFFNKNLVDGKSFNVKDSGRSDQVLISSYHASKLNLKVGDPLSVYFIQNEKQRARRLQVCGIYSTGLGDIFDQVYIIADIGHIQKLNGWDSTQVAGFEVLCKDYSQIDNLRDEINDIIGFDFLAESIKELNRPVFSWLDAQDINAVVIMVLMALVAGINMISALLILILESTGMIGILKAIGMNNWGVRKVFIYNAGYLILRGMLWGNLIGITLCILQKKFDLVGLDERTYYLKSIPIHFDWLNLSLLNIGTFVLCLTMLVVPSYIVTYITPAKALRFS